MLTRTEDDEDDYEILQDKINALCDLACDKNTTLSQIEKFFADHPDVDIDGRDSNNSMRAIDYAAESGNVIVFNYLFVEKNADVDAAIDDLNLIQHASNEDSSPEVRKYIYENDLWKNFSDGTTKLDCEVWFLALEEAKKIVDRELSEAKENHDHRKFKEYIKLRVGYDPKDTLLKYYREHPNNRHHRSRPQKIISPGLAIADVTGDAGIRASLSPTIVLYDEDKPKLPLVIEFCNLLSNKKTTKAHIQTFLSLHPDFDINTPHPETNLKPVLYAMQRGSKSSFQYLIEDLQADLTYNGPLTDIMTFRNEKLKIYIAKHKLWRRLNNGTTDIHGYAWSGDIDALLNELEKDPDRISDLTNDNRSVFTWANESLASILSDWGDQYIRSLSRPEDKEKLIKFNFCMGHTSHARGKYELAIAAFSYALKLHDELPFSLTNDATEFSDKIKRCIATEYASQLININVIINGTKADVLYKCFFDTWASIHNKTKIDIDALIVTLWNFGNAYYLVNKQYLNVEGGDINEMYSAYLTARDYLQKASNILTTYPPEIHAQLKNNPNSAIMLQGTLQMIAIDQYALTQKINFLNEVLYPDSVSLHKNTKTEKKESEEKHVSGKEEKRDDEEEKPVPPPTYLTYPGVLYPRALNSSSSSSTSSSSRAPQPPPDSHTEEFKQLHLR